MKTLILLATVLSLSLAIERFDVKSLDIESLQFDLDEYLVNDILDKYDAFEDDPGVTAVVNEYADKILKNIEALAIKNNLDPLNLTDIEEDFLTASITLTNGHLNGISTIDRSGDVEITYYSTDKRLEVHLPIVFSDLNFTYDYHVIILLIGPKGSIVGEIKDFKMDIKLIFDFNTYHAAVQNIETTNKGHVSLTFHGNAIVDVVVNTLSEFVTAVLQPLIEMIIEDVVSEVANRVVEGVNDAIDGILNVATTTDSSIVTTVEALLQ